MNILVCVKQVPDLSENHIDAQTHTLQREDAVSIVNPFDESALYLAIQLKKRNSGLQDYRALNGTCLCAKSFTDLPGDGS